MTFPNAISQYIKDSPLVANTTGCSGATVYRVYSMPCLYLKVATTKKAMDELRYEADFLAWLAGRLPVPSVVAFEKREDNCYLLTEEVPGVPASEALHDDQEGCVTLLGQALRLFHSISIVDCPFDQGLDAKLALARSHVDNGAVDEDDFGEECRGMNAQEILDMVVVQRPLFYDPVLTHGDYCLPNIIVMDGNLSGFIDLGQGGVSDRYQDLALALRSLKHNFMRLGGEGWSPKYGEAFLAAYGLVDRFDEEKAMYYRMLDELF